MQLKNFTLFAALAGTAYSQMMGLNATLSNTNEVSTLAKTLAMFPNLVSTLAKTSNITILAPSNAAFQKFMKMEGKGVSNSAIEALLTYHVIKGVYYSTDIKATPAFVHTLLTDSQYSEVSMGQVVEAAKVGKDVVFTSGLLQTSTVTKADVKFTGGVIHIIDQVLTPPMTVSDTAAATNLTAFAGAVEALKLTSTADNTKDLTIFAPNNDAFQAIASGLGSLSNSQLTSILEYHVVKGTVGYSSLLKNGMTLKTLGGKDVTITIKKGEVFVNEAAVVLPNVLVENGVVHVIDQVLNPSVTSTVSGSKTTGVPVYKGASSAAKVPFTSDVSASTTINTAAATSATGGSGGKKSSSSSGAAVPLKTAGVGAAALFGAGVAFLNY